MKKMTKAMYGKSMMQDGGSTKMKKYQNGGIPPVSRKEARQNTKAAVKKLIDKGVVSPIEGVKLRMEAAKKRRAEAKMKKGGVRR